MRSFTITASNICVVSSFLELSPSFCCIFCGKKEQNFELGQCYYHIFIKHKIGLSSSDGNQSSVLWNHGFCNLAQECWLWWLPGWESCLYCFLRDTNKLAVITIELCTQWLAGMLRFLCTVARDKWVSHTFTVTSFGKKTPYKEKVPKLKIRHACVCTCILLNIWVFVHSVSCLHAVISLSAVEGAHESKPFCAAVCCAAIPLKTWAGTRCTTTSLSRTHTNRHAQWETRLFHWPHQTPSATLPTRHIEFHWVLAFPIRAAFMTLHSHSLCCIKTFELLLKCSRSSTTPSVPTVK